MIELSEDYNVNSNLNSLEEEIYYAIKNISDTLPPQTSSHIWTHEIFTAIGNIGTKRGFSIHSTTHNKEWMYDLVWCKRNEHHIESIHLVFESELFDRTSSSNGRVALLRDFEKLLIANSEFKVMLCFNEGNRDYPHNIGRVFDLFRQSFNNYKNHNANSRLLLMVIDDFWSGDVVPHIFET